MGYYKGDLNFKGEDYNKAVVRVTKINGVASYEVLTNYDAFDDEKENKHCYYYNFSTIGVDDINISVDNNDAENQLKLDTTIKKNKDEENSYLLRMQLADADIFDKIIEMGSVMPDVYVSFVLDASGSMKSNDIKDANGNYVTRWSMLTAATKEMIGELQENFKTNLHLEIIKFESGVTKLKSFDENKSIEELALENQVTTGGTYIADGLSMAYDGIKDIDSDYKYVIVLSDGDESSENCLGSCLNSCTNINDCAKLLKDNMVFTFIGYGRSTKLDRYSSVGDSAADLYYPQVVNIDEVLVV